MQINSINDIYINYNRLIVCSELRKHYIIKTPDDEYCMFLFVDIMHCLFILFACCGCYITTIMPDSHFYVAEEHVVHNQQADIYADKCCQRDKHTFLTNYLVHKMIWKTYHAQSKCCFCFLLWIRRNNGFSIISPTPSISACQHLLKYIFIPCLHGWSRSSENREMSMGCEMPQKG